MPKLSLPKGFSSSPARLAQALIFAIVALNAGAAAASTFCWGNQSPLSYYYLAIVMGALFWAGWQFTFPVEEKLMPRWAARACVALTLLSAYLCFRHIGSISYWTDEDFTNGQLLLHKNTVDAAAWTLQPPTYFYFTVLGRKLVGNSLFGLRFFTALFATLSTPLVFLLFLRLLKRPLLALFGAALFLLNPWIVSYAAEAKPLLCGIFFLLVFLHTALSFHLAPGWKSGLGYFVASVLLLLSLGFQPALVLAAFGAASLVAFLMGGNRKAAELLLLAGVASVFVFLPFQLNILERRQFFLHESAGLDSRLQALGDFSAQLAKAWPELSGMSPWLALLAYLPLWYLSRKRRSGLPTFGFSLAAAAIFFRWEFLVAYGLLVNYLFRERYAALYYPLFLAAFFMGVEVAEKLARDRWPAHGKKIGFLAVSFALLVSVGVGAATFGAQKKPLEYLWPRFYERMAKEASSGDLAFIFTLGTNGTFTLHAFPSTDFYYTPDVKAKVRLESVWEKKEEGKGQVAILLDAIDRGDTPGNIFLVYMNQHSEVDFTRLKYPRSSPEFSKVEENPGNAYTYRDLTVMKLSAKGDLGGTLKKFLLDVEPQVKNRETLGRLYELLAAISLREKNCSQVVAYLLSARRLPQYDVNADEQFGLVWERARKVCREAILQREWRRPFPGDGRDPL